MSLKGTIKPGFTVTGSIRELDYVLMTAYGVAIQNGFKGTEKEWLESLKGEKGEKGEKGDSSLTEKEKEAMIEELIRSKPDISGITVTKANSVVVVEYSLGDGSTQSDSMTLDSNGFPDTVVANGVSFPVKWEGFNA